MSKEAEMARMARIVVAQCPHHIVQRGHNRRVVFVTDGDRKSYLETLAEFRTELGLKVYAYCLMTNHVHLIVDPGVDVGGRPLGTDLFLDNDTV
jgi:putative transposase